MPSRGGARLRVLFFTSSLGSGGAERHLVRVANHLDRSRFDVSVAVSRAGGSYESELRDDVRFLPLGSPRMVRSVAPLRRLVRTERPDLLCSFMDHANCVALAATTGLPRAPRVVAGVQNTVSREFGPGRGARSAVIRALIPHLYARADRIVALSRGVGEDLAHLAPHLGDRISVVYNAGCDDDVVRAGAEPVEDAAGAPVIVACGRLTEQKGYPFLLRALARLRAAGSPARLWIVGDGELRQALEGEVAALGLGDAVRFWGFQDNPYRFMRAADVFVLPSLWEGFGNVIVEAMALGTPVVATDCPHGPREILQDTHGLLVPPGDVEALAGALGRVLASPELRASLRDAGRRRAGDFSAPLIASQYGQLFETVVAAGA